MVHGKAPIGTRPRLVRSCRPATRVDGSSRRHRRASLKLGQTPAAGRHQPILTVLKRSVVLWVKEAMK
jgi:hypothetical protein